MKYKFNPSKVRFVDDIFLYKLFSLLAQPFGLSAKFIVREKRPGSYSYLDDEPDILQLGRLLNYEDRIIDKLCYHEKIINNAKKIESPFYYLIALLGIIGILVMLVILGGAVSSGIGRIGLVILSYLFIFIWPAIVIKLIFLVKGSLLPESIVIDQIIYLLVYISRDNVLQEMGKKKILLLKLDRLANSILGIARTYGNYLPSNKNRYMEHFLQISTFVRERAKLVILSKEDTLEQIRTDLYNLSVILISGNYGNFESNDQELSISIPKSSSPKTVIKILGFLMPIILMGLYITHSELFPIPNLDKTVVEVFFISWVLITIDNVLELGAIENIVKIAKALREL